MLKNALYLDKNYKKDCEKKINYTDPSSTVSTTKEATDSFTKAIRTDYFKQLDK